VGVTGAGPCAFRWRQAERALDEGGPAAATLAALRLPADGLNGDLSATPAYRAHLVHTLLTRALTGLQ
jgi:carbon-monoxide dehydrogenase medium subunit